ncbi:hypothetical protein [Nostoc linckia]|uniref:hypothetical protein n=1 Tax=Nostoc linckia TaxID=92942 RepID=UPI0011808814|nr:hypothetical protein [Nostoc linckia]
MGRWGESILVPIHQNIDTHTIICRGERLYPAGRQSLRPYACICIIYKVKWYEVSSQQSTLNN